MLESDRKNERICLRIPPAHLYSLHIPPSDYYNSPHFKEVSIVEEACVNVLCINCKNVL